MRIISSFHDYYDSVMNVGGHDNTIIYNRCSKEEWMEQFPISHPFYLNFSQHTSYDLICVVFCGEMYWRRSIKNWNGKNITGCYDVVYEWNAWKQWEKEARSGGKICFKSSYGDKSNIVDFRRQVENADWHELNLKHNSPILLYEKTSYQVRLTKNPALSEINFVTVIDPWSAFQKLEKFVDNHFSQQPEIITLSNKDRIAKHGFDKWSFRKEPTKRKKT